MKKFRLFNAQALILRKIFRQTELLDQNYMGYSHHYHRLGRFCIAFAFVFIFLGSTFAQAQTADEIKATPEYASGKSLFEANCQSCHKIHEKLTGPPLAGVYDKYDAAWLYKWIKNSTAMVKSGDAAANKIFNEYNQSVMTAFPALKDAEIDQIMKFVQGETLAGPAKPAVTAADPNAGAGDAKKGALSDTFLALIGIVLLIMVLLMTRVLRALDNLNREKAGLPLRPGFSLEQTLNASWFRTLAGILAFILLASTVFKSASNLGYQKNYQPTQPIKYSHKIHAGQFGIDCQYCHVGASAGKSAVIPSVSTCMNCHKGIDKGATTGTTEIAKIYDAVGWDPKTKKYIEGYKQKPVEWIRIHNLPDHVYFNHSQHVVAGKIECQKCHGKIEEMDVVKQENTLGMGWCIDCHRTTNVQFESNAYYNSYEKYHQEIKDKKRTGVTVEDIGGTECQKCHY